MGAGWQNAPGYSPGCGEGGREGKVTLSAKAMKIQDTLGCHHENGGAMLSFGWSTPLLSPTGGPASGFSSSRDTTVQVPGSRRLQHSDFCQSETSQSCMACLCKKNKTNPNPEQQNTACVCISFSEAPFGPLLMSLQQVSIAVNTAANTVKNLIQRERVKKGCSTSAEIMLLFGTLEGFVCLFVFLRKLLGR